MNRIHSSSWVGVISTLLVVGCTPTDQSTATWQSKINQVRVGMTRSEVERLLPQHPSSPLTRTVTGSTQGETYWVDPLWKVAVVYDYTGIPRDSSGKALSHESPGNKVLAIPTLTREDMPEPIKIDSIKVIENTEPGAAADADKRRRGAQR